jgi:hypothetical protein
MELSEVVSVAGSRSNWRVMEIGWTKGRKLSDGYQEPDWQWAELVRADGFWPGFAQRVSVSSCRPV